jgi:K+-sensing histidine kinase KdpD
LIDNAVKYAGAARVRLFRESDRVVISIEDDGPGIPIAQQEKVFTAFYRLEPSRNIATGGWGLGLVSHARSPANTVETSHSQTATVAASARVWNCRSRAAEIITWRTGCYFAVWNCM